MKASCVDRPVNDRFIPIREWQIQFCEDKFTSDDGKKKPLIAAAALMSFFEHWHNVKLQMNEKSSRMNDVSELHGDERIQDESLLQFHTSQDIEAALMGLAAEDQIRRARKFLVECGVITEHSNPNPRYKFDKTIYYQFHPEILNEYIRNEYPKNRVSYPKNRDGEPKNRGPYKENTAGDVLLEKEPKTPTPEPRKAKPSKRAGVACAAATEIDFSKFDQPEVASALWAEWVEYKKAQHGQKYKTVKSAQIQVNLLLKYSDGKSETAKQILELSMGNLYQGIIEPKQKSVVIKDGAVFSAAPPTPDDFPLTDDMQKRYDSTTSWFYKNCPSCTGVRWLSKKEFMSVMNRSEDLIPPMWYTKCPEDDFNAHVTRSISSLNASPRWEKEKWPSIFEWLRHDLKIRIFGKKDNQ